MFNPEEFMNAEFEGEFSTKRELIPDGEYQLMLEELEAKTIGEANYPIFSIKYKIINNSDEDLDGRPIYDTIWLDVDERGALVRAPGKNIRLGQLLEALGLNGRPWRAGLLTGQVLMAQIKTRQNKRSGDMENYIQKVTGV